MKLNTFKSLAVNWMSAVCRHFPDKLTVGVGLPDNLKDISGLFYSYTEYEVNNMGVIYADAASGQIDCASLASRLRNAAALGEQKINELRGRERNIRACISDLRNQLANCKQNSSPCTSNDWTIISNSLASIEHTIAEMDSILSLPC